MDAYKELAYSYDRLTNDVDYEAVVDFYFEIWYNGISKYISVINTTKFKYIIKEKRHGTFCNVRFKQAYPSSRC